MKKLYPHEIEYLSDPDRFTFAYFRDHTLQHLPLAAALGVADEELLNYYENRSDRDARFVLRLDPNGGHYRALEEFVADAACRLIGERVGDAASVRAIETTFTTFRTQLSDALRPYPELQKVQLLKKIALGLSLPPTFIDDAARLFSPGSSIFAMELLADLTAAGRAEEFSREVARDADALAALSARPMLLTPLWNHQRRALEAWTAGGMKGVLEMATATGKTLVGLAAAQKLYELHGRLHVRVMAHSRALLDQWRREAIDKLGFIGDPQADYRSPLAYSDRFVIEFSTVQKVSRNPRAFPTDLLIVDEVHHSAGREFRNIFSVPCRWKMGLSATVEGAEREKVLDRLLGRTVFTYTLKDARDEGVVPEFALLVHTTYLEIAEDREFREISRQILRLLGLINAQHQKIILALSNRRFGRFSSLADFVRLMKASRYTRHEVPEEWRQLLGLVYARRLIIHRSAPKTEQAAALIRRIGDRKKCVVFSMDITTCDRLYDAVRESVPAFRVHSRLTRGEVRQALADFRRCRAGVLIAPRMLDEGIDVPDAEIGINVASAKTQLQLVQRMGRILRKRSGKQPVFHHFVALPRAFVADEDSFAYLGDLAWISDVAVNLGIPMECVEAEEAEVSDLARQSEEVVRSYYRAHRCIAADDFGTIRIRAVVDSIEDAARSRLIALLDSRQSPLTDAEWVRLLRDTYNQESTSPAVHLRWLLIIAERDPQKIVSLLSAGHEAPAEGGKIVDLPIPANVDRDEEEAQKIATWIAALRRGKDRRQRQNAARRLVAAGPAAVRPLTDLTKDRSAEVQIRAIRVLGAIRDPAAIDPLTVCLRSPDHVVRQAAARALGDIGNPRARLSLTRALRDRDTAVVRAVRQALRSIESDAQRDPGYP